MRLWVKLILLVLVAVGAQALIERNAGAIDDAMLMLQVTMDTCDPNAAPSEECMQLARRVMEREQERRVLSGLVQEAAVCAAGDGGGCR